jgi:hypothetical protein
MVIAGIGALFFGLVIGWISYRILRMTASTTAISDIAAIIAAVGGAAVITLFRSDVMFGWYCIGLALGFFAYLGFGVYTYGKQEVQPWRLTNSSLAPAINSPSVSPTDVSDTSEVESEELDS